MKVLLRALIVEDSEDDARLLARALTRAGYDVRHERVDSAEAMRSALDRETWDIILSDFSMPNFRGTDALKLVRERDEDTPFIFVSGTMGEDVAVEAMRSGAQDYVIKNNLTRLVPAIERELRDVAVRRERRASEARFRRIADSAMIGILFWDPHGTITDANDQFLKIVGYTREDLQTGRMNWRAMTPPEYEPAEAKALEELEAGGTCTPFEKECIRKDGSRVPIIFGGALLDEPDRPGVAFVLDITARKEAEEALRARARQQAAVAQLGERAIETADLSELCHSAVSLVSETLNVPYCKVLELATSGTSFLLRAGVGWREGCVGHVTVGVGEDSQAGYTLRHGEPVLVEDLRAEARFRGTSLLHDHGVVSGVTVVIPSKSRAFGVLGAHSDRTRLFTQDDLHFLQAVAHILGTTIDRDRAEAASRQSQRLESVGRLAGGVAHDFNNLLTAITGYSELLLTDLKAGDPMRDDIEEIRKAAGRASALTRQLLAFSRRQVLEPRPLDLNGIIEDMEKMLRRLIGEDIELRTMSLPDLGIVRADPAQIEQVIVNLVVNARDAMPEGGKLTIETANVELDETYVDQRGDTHRGRYVMLAVSDTGVGMDRETQARIFEPFFTTKGPEHGTGLGLATVYGIVKQSGGNIWVYSEPGHGTTFKVYLPVVLEEAEVARRAEPVPVPLHGSETVLLVEDEEAVRRLAQRILEQAGYTVLVARNGAEALLIGERHPSPIHLVVSDVVMPQMGGGELIGRLSATRPELRVLYLSGYTDPGVVQQGLLGKGAAFLQKPFTAEALTRKVRDVLGSGR